MSGPALLGCWKTKTGNCSKDALRDAQFRAGKSITFPTAKRPGRQTWPCVLSSSRNTASIHNLGGKKDRGYMAEDVEMFKTLRSHGVQGVWVPRAHVQHFIVKGRLRTEDTSGRTFIVMAEPKFI